MAFDIDTTSVVLNGQQLSGFSEEENAIEIPEITLANVKYGADGRMITSSTGTKGGPVTFRFLFTSPSVIFLNDLAEQQKKGAIIVYNCVIVSHSTGLKAELKRGSMLTYPFMPTLGKGSVGSAVYGFSFEECISVTDNANLR